MNKIKSLPPPLAEDFNNKWDTFCIAAENTNVMPPDDSDIFSALRQVFACSDFIAKTCTRDPQMLIDLIESGDLQRHYPAGEYVNKLDILLSPLENNGELPDNSATPHSRYGTRDWVTGLQRTLRNIRSREMVRIGWRDLAGWTCACVPLVKMARQCSPS